MSHFVIGIDLGTTNCTMSYTLKTQEELKQEELKIEQISIPQIGEGGVLMESFSLPSFLYFSLPQELKEHFVLGHYAKHRGSEIPARVIASAKSWLCNSGMERKEKILPYSKEDGLDRDQKMSPVEVCAEFLKHLKKTWETSHPSHLFKEQEVLVTVPASFDPSAKELVEESARLADFPEVTLIEEPLAAFYSWLQKHDSSWREELKVGECVLVVDIGGGTTDFTLIVAEENQGTLELRRSQVGVHLLLGGDNLDLALAYHTRQKLEEKGHTIDESQFEKLKSACRIAKEEFLGENPPETKEIVIQGRGTKLIGAHKTVTLEKEEVQKLILDGFFPLISKEERSRVEKRSGIQEVGLPFAKDPRVSSQLAKFLSVTGETESSDMDHFILPTKVLFNGGTLKAKLIRERLIDLLNFWAKELKKPNVQELSGGDLDFAVSHGACFYGHLRHGKGVRVKSGAARSYFVGVEDAVPAVPGFTPKLSAVCVVPFGMEEGSEKVLEEEEFALILGEMASFRFFSRLTPTLSDGKEPIIGTVVKNWKSELTELDPLETILQKSGEDGKVVRVSLRSKVTELGVLELWCESKDAKKWKLEFNIRS